MEYPTARLDLPLLVSDLQAALALPQPPAVAGREPQTTDAGQQVDGLVVVPDALNQTTVAAVIANHPTRIDETERQAAAERTVEATIRERADTALATNASFLNRANPTNAQVVEQVKALTRQSNGLIRLALRRFDSAD